MDEWQSPEQASGMGCISGKGVCVCVPFFFLWCDAWACVWRSGGCSAVAMNLI